METKKTERELRAMEKQWEKTEDLPHRFGPGVDFWTTEKRCIRGFTVTEVKIVPEKSGDEKRLTEYRHCILNEFAEDVLKKQGGIIRKEPRQKIKKFYEPPVIPFSSSV